MSDDKRSHPGGRRSNDAEQLLRLAALERRMDHLEETRTREFGVLRQMMTNNADLMKANTAITEKTFNLVGPYIDNLEAMSKFTSALGVIGDSLHWFGDRMIRLAKPVLVIIAALGGCVVAWRAFQSGNLLEALRALVGLF